MNEQIKERPRKRKIWIILVSVSVPVIVLIVVIAVFLLGYYRADETAIAALQSDDSVTVTKTGYGYFFDGPSEDSALIFYPGANVEETAYAPLMHSLAAEGLDTCLVKMPLRLAIFGVNAADNVQKPHSFTKWYIGGHSLGGAIASSYAADHADTMTGLILLAAYPTAMIPDTMTEIQLLGSEDGVINRNRLRDADAYAPENLVRFIIQGGNHAQFGSYGEQDGDGAATISPEEQIRQTAHVIISVLSQ